MVACQLHEDVMLKLADFLYINTIPFVNVTSYGLLGSLRTAVPEFLGMLSFACDV